MERARLPVARGLERVGGIQGQYAPSAYVGLWSRLAPFRRQDLTNALERRAAVQGTLMRVTIHVVSARDYWPFAEAIRRERREWWSKAARRQVVARSIEEAARRVRDLFADGPIRREEIMTRLGIDSVTWNGVGVWMDLVRVPPSGTWERRRADLYALAEDWLGPSTATEDEGREHLVRRYLGAFGPASRSDISSWSGLSPATLAPVFERLKLRRFADERGGELLDVGPRAAPGSGDPGPGPLPPHVGRDAAGARTPDPAPARALPLARIRHQDAALGTDLPRRRTCGGDLERGTRPGEAEAVRTAFPRGSHRDGGGGAPA